MRTRLIWFPLAASLLGVVACNERPANPAARDRTSTAATATSAAKATAKNAAKNAATRDLRAVFEAIEAETAACMTEKGWEYRPMSYVEPDASSMSPAGMMDSERGKQHGYGITEGFSSASVAPGGTGSVVISSSSGEVPTDPNVDYVDSLSAAEMEQYFRDLQGEMTPTDVPDAADDDTASGAISVGFGSGGCRSKATEKVDPGSEDRMKGAAEAFNELANDPDLVAAATAWSSCMADRGYELDKPENATADFMNRAAKELGFGGPTDPSKRPEHDPAVVRRLLAEEIELWTADFECQTSSKYRSTFERLNGEIMKRFGFGS